MQRCFDILFAGLAVIFLSPLLVPIALLLRFTGEGEIFFLQERIGKGGRPFNLFKFATMLKNSPNIATGTVTVKGDTRILPVGKFLRKTKINELPQLFNILLGDMSLVGPRPLTKQTFSAYAPETQAVVLRVRPGLSGIGSVIFRDEENMLHGQHDALEYYHHVVAPYKGAVERWYVENNRFSNYFAIILATVWVVIHPRSTLAWRLFPTLPPPPRELQATLSHPG